MKSALRHQKWFCTAQTIVSLGLAAAACLGSGQSASSSLLCGFFGQTTPFTATQLSTLYTTHEDYVSKVTMATASAQEARFILQADAPAIVAEAQAAPVPP
jgi:Alpha/beta hydrolase domain